MNKELSNNLQIMTQKEVAQMLETNQHTISLIEKRAFKKIQKIIEKRGYKLDDFFGKD